VSKTGYYAQKRSEMAAFVPERRSRVLDIGCGEGHFSLSLSGVTERWGVEPTDAADVASTLLDKVIRGTFEEAEADLPEAYFDVIICNDVIEHMVDHDRFLSSVGKYLAPGGMLVGSIPNARYYQNLFELLLEKDWRYRDSGILDVTHLRFFTEKSLIRALTKHGFQIEHFARINRFVDTYHNSRTRLYRMLARAVTVCSFGYFSDMYFLQFAFCVSPTVASLARYQHSALSKLEDAETQS
jgi:2-polyprenyl-3-methyl-5-hydroxy-6-metoxy-1,4-benzoquinol methylase